MWYTTDSRPHGIDEEDDIVHMGSMRETVIHMRSMKLMTIVYMGSVR